MTLSLKQVTIRGLLLVMLLFAIFSVLLIAYSPERSVEICFVGRESGGSYLFRVNDNSLFPSLISTDHSGAPILVTEQKNPFSIPGSFRSSTSKTWVGIPKTGFEFETDQIMNGTTSFRIALHMKEQFGWRKKWMWSEWFIVNGENALE